MRSRTTWAALAAASLALLAAPVAAGRINIGFPLCINIEDEDGDRLRLRITQDGKTLKVDARGRFEVNDDETDFTSVEPGGSLRIEERRRGRTTHRLEVRGLPGGGIQRTYRAGGRTREMDAEGRAWLAGVLSEMLRNTTFAADARVKRLLERSGVDGVLAEIARIASDHAKRTYYAALLDQAGSDPATAERVARDAAARIGSDHELAELVLQVADSASRNDAVLAACVDATHRIGSDHEHARALQGILVRGHAGPELAAAVARSAADIGSDHERAGVLVDLADTQSIGPAWADAYFDAVDGIGSDHERKRTLVSVLARDGSEPAVLSGAVRCVAKMGSDHESAEVLVALADVHALDGPLAEAYCAAASRIGSDHEHGRVLLAVLHRADELPPEVVRPLVASSEEIGSDSKRAEVLLDLVRLHELDGDLRALVADSARGIGSDYHQKRVLEALESRRL